MTNRYYLHGCEVRRDGTRDSFWTRGHDTIDDAMADARTCSGRHRFTTRDDTVLRRGDTVIIDGLQLSLQVSAI